MAHVPTDAQARKAIPVYSGFIKYFPKAILKIAELSRIGNDQHNPGKPLHWDRTKSTDELDALMRHMLDADGMDTDNVLHATKIAWRAMANLEKVCEAIEAKSRNAQAMQDHPAHGNWEKEAYAAIDRMRIESTMDTSNLVRFDK